MGSWESFALGVINGRRKGPAFDAFRGVLFGLSTAYETGLSVYLFAERAGIRKRVRLPVPTISIGNITSGGTGKTPLTELLAKRLAADGYKPAILSRGHGGSASKGVGQVSSSDGKVLMGADESGDEACLLARLLPGVPVFVGRDRRQSAKAALELESPDAIVLDDGMQYWQLARNLDIALVDARHPFENGFVLPRGALREPKENLKRAGVILVTRADLVSVQELAALKSELRGLARASDIFASRHTFGGLRPMNDAAESTLPARPLAVCGIAQPDQFFAMLNASEIDLSAQRSIALHDHASIDDHTRSVLLRKMSEYRADSIIMTEKDAIKVDATKFDIPVYAAKLALEIEDISGFFEAVYRRAGLQSKYPKPDVSTTK